MEKVGRVTSLETIQRVYQFLLKIKKPREWQNNYSKEAIEQRKQQEKNKDKSRPSEYVYEHLVGEALSLRLCDFCKGSTLDATIAVASH